MQYNNTATQQGIFQDVDFLCHTDSASYSIEDKTRSLNNWQDFVVAEILDSMDEWDFQGNKAYSNLVANQQAYPFPTDILKIKRVEIDYDGDGDYVPADAIDSSTLETTIATSAEINDYFSEGDPKYDAYNNSAFLYPVPDTAVNSGLIFWFESNVTEFTATAANNTAEPVFARPFHKILSLGPSLDYAKQNGINGLIAYCEKELFGTVASRKGRIGGLISKLRRFYGSRTADKILSVRTKYYKENYR